MTALTLDQVLARIRYIEAMYAEAQRVGMVQMYLSYENKLLVLREEAKRLAEEAPVSEDTANG